MKVKQFVRIALLGGAAAVSSSALAANVIGTDVLVFVAASNGQYYIGDSGVALSSILSVAQIQAGETAGIAANNPNLNAIDTTTMQGPQAAQLNASPNLASFMTTNSCSTAG